MSDKVLKVVSIGGFGHTVCVFDEMIGFEKAQLVGLAPAFEGEDISFTLNHDLVTDDIKVYDDYKTMLEEVKPDVAIISSQLNEMPQVTIDAANAGCHLICEKPLALDVATLEKVYDAVKKNNVKLTAMLTMRSENIFRAAKQAYDSGVIGEAVLCNGRKSYKYGTRPEWFGNRKLYGGTVAWVGIHAFDFINYVTGLKFTNVAAMGGNFAHPERPECHDNVAICSTMSNGGHATVSVDYLRPMESVTHGDDWVRVVGTKGVIESRGSNVTCTLHTGEKPVEVELPEKSKMFQQFMLSILGECEYEFAQELSFELTHVCLSCESAIDSGKVVDVEQGKWN